MNTDKLNGWLSLIANAGVLIGIIFVVFELRQTQTAMEADSSSIRTESSIENSRLNIEFGISAITTKLATGETLSDEEGNRVRLFYRRLARHFENLHYQWQLGVLDEEIWNSNLDGISSLSGNPGFDYAFPGWPESVMASRYRKSFVDLVESFRE